MKLRLLVGIADGVKGDDQRAFEPGSIHPARVPVLFDHDYRKPIGSAELSTDGDRVYADMTIADSEWAAVIGRTPALGYRSHEQGKRVEVLEISLNSSRNADPRIPAIAGG
jgi:hypothetical protein